MRKVVLTISKLGLAIGDIVNIKLVDSVGRVYVSPFGYQKDENITIASSVLEIDLLENDLIPNITSYKITLPNALNFTFRVTSSTGTLESHDLISLFNIGCVHGVIDTFSHTLDADFVEKLNHYFTGENPHFTAAQKDIVALYEYYANEIIDTTITIDVIEMMDTYLSTLIGVQNA